MRLDLRCGLFCALLIAVSPGGAAAQDAPATVHARLTKIARALTFVMAQRHPMDATALGIAGYDGDLETPSEAYRAEDLKLLLGWQAQVRAISAAAGTKLSLTDADDVKLLQAQLTSSIRAYTVYDEDRKDYSAPANAVVGAIFTQFQALPIPGRDGATHADLFQAWNDIIARLSKAPAYIVASERLVTTPGHLYGVVGDQELQGVPDFFNGALTAAAKSQLPADRFQRFVAARDAVLATIGRTRAYIAAHVASWPENYAIGVKAYDAMMRDEMLLPYDAHDLEVMGAAELQHGWAEEAWLTQLSRLRGTPFGPATGGGIAPGGPALIPYYHARIAQLRAFVVSHHIISIPNWLGAINVVETPTFLQPVSPGASMNPPRLFSKETDGYYYITPPKSLADAAKRLDMNEDFDRDRILSTAAHEAMPGHFLQLSIAKRNPDFIRRIQDSSVFQEGWAFYGEEMFVRLGLYGDDLDGRLYVARWERVRGARAIVDAELATGAWSVAQATRYFAQQTGFTKDAAEAEVDAIALGPGDFMVYTVGRAQLEALEGEYMRRTHGQGTLEDFHDRLMCYGSSPFAIVAPELLHDLDKPLSEVRAAADY